MGIKIYKFANEFSKPLCLIAFACSITSREADNNYMAISDIDGKFYPPFVPLSTEVKPVLELTY